MIEAWFSASEITSVSAEPSAVRRPTFAAYPLAKNNDEGSPTQLASSRSSSRWTARVP